VGQFQTEQRKTMFPQRRKESMTDKEWLNPFAGRDDYFVQNLGGLCTKIRLSMQDVAVKASN
jgi:hypothetical protein